MIGTDPGKTRFFVTRFLVSVRSAREAAMALSGGADIIDLKEPGEGALGSVSPAVAGAAVEAVAGRRPVSATIGDCPLADAPARVIETAATGVDYVKIGLFGEADARSLQALERCAAGGIRMIAVMFADRAPDLAMPRRLAESGFCGVMLDTADKGSGGLRNHMDPRRLGDFLSASRAHGLMAGLAGSLNEGDARALLPLRPDVLGFRGALCARAKRAGQLEERRVAAMHTLILRGCGAGRAAGPAVMAEDG